MGVHVAHLGLELVLSFLVDLLFVVVHGPAAARAAHEPPVLLGELRSLHSCLLYTSDAADE